jgi:MSHA biogenesis protein MshQ
MQRILVFLNKGPLRLIPVVLIMVLVASIIMPAVAQADPGWYDYEWQYRKKITINSANVTGDQSDFPVLISITDSDLASKARNDGYDILFTEDNEVSKLQHEIESFNGTSGQLVAWVKIPSLLAATDTEIYMYYGNAGASDQQNAAGVWDDNYMMVQHMQEDPSGTPPQMIDSTSHNNDGTSNGTMLSEDLIDGQINGGVDLDGDNDYVGVDYASTLSPTSAITVEAWAKPGAATDTYPRIISRASRSTHAAPYDSWNIFVNDVNTGFLTGRLAINGTKYDVTTTIGYGAIQGDWHQFIVTFDGTNAKVYLDGDEKVSEVHAGSISYYDNQPVRIGNYEHAESVTYFHGLIDEVRVSNTARDADWIETSYKNQLSPADFLSLGSEENRPIEVPTVIGGLVLPINKATVLAPWLCLATLLFLTVGWVILRLRKRRSPRQY